MLNDVFDEVYVEGEIKSFAKELNLPEEKVRRIYKEAINELKNKAKIMDYIHLLIKKEIKAKLKT